MFLATIGYVLGLATMLALFTWQQTLRTSRQADQITDLVNCYHIAEHDPMASERQIVMNRIVDHALNEELTPHDRRGIAAWLRLLDHNWEDARRLLRQPKRPMTARSAVF